MKNTDEPIVRDRQHGHGVFLFELGLLEGFTGATAGGFACLDFFFDSTTVQPVFIFLKKLNELIFLKFSEDLLKLVQCTMLHAR